MAALPLLLAAACADKSATSNPEPAASTTGASAAIAEAPAGTFTGTKATGSPVKIGLINPEGGPAINMPEGRVAAEAAAKYANENLGGIGGHPIELDICKSKEDPASAGACANQMVQDGVAGVVVTNTGNGPSMAPIISKAGIAYTGYQAAAAEEILAPTAFIWTGGIPAGVTAMAKEAVKAGAKKITILVTDNATTVAAVKALAEPIVKAAGLELTVTPVPLGVPDASPQVAAGLKNNPEVVSIIGDAGMCTASLKALSTLGSTATRYVIQPCMDPSVYQAAASELDGSRLFTTSDGTSDTTEAKIYRAVMAKYAPDAIISGSAQTAFQSMLGFVRAVNAGLDDAAGEPTAASIVTALKAAKDVPLPLGDGILMTCDGKQIPGLSGFCSAGSLVGTIKGGQVASFAIVS